VPFNAYGGVCCRYWAPKFVNRLPDCLTIIPSHQLQDYMHKRHPSKGIIVKRLFYHFLHKSQYCHLYWDSTLRYVAIRFGSPLFVFIVPCLRLASACPAPSPGELVPCLFACSTAGGRWAFAAVVGPPQDLTAWRKILI